MIQKFDKTVLLVFSLSVAKEYQRKSFAGLQNAATSVALINQCISHTRAIVEESGLEVLWFDEHQQYGRNFAERYTNAVKSCFDRGYDRVISIGNDSPDLHTAIIRTAAEKLLQNDVVVGPTQDGGVYLLGLTKDAFDEETFVQLPWQKNSLYDAFLSSSEEREQKVVSLERLIDLDDFESIQTYVKSRPASIISRLITRLTSSDQQTCLPLFVIVLPKVHIATNPFRGPPSLNS